MGLCSEPWAGGCGGYSVWPAVASWHERGRGPLMGRCRVFLELTALPHQAALSCSVGVQVVSGATLWCHQQQSDPQRRHSPLWAAVRTWNHKMTRQRVGVTCKKPQLEQLRPPFSPCFSRWFLGLEARAGRRDRRAISVWGSRVQAGHQEAPASSAQRALGTCHYQCGCRVTGVLARGQEHELSPFPEQV